MALDLPHPNSVLSAPPSGVTVRMYNPGFGDCLLLAFRAADGSPRYLLIDCGAHHRYPNRAALLQKVAHDIGLATGNHLHIVAATHQHTDHLDGFKLASPEFDRIQIDHLWLAWTEDPEDAVANRLRKDFDRQLRAVFGAVNQLRAAGHPGADAITRVLDFEYAPALGADGGAQAPLPYLRARAKNPPRNSADYLRPGQRLGLPDVPGVKVYVLGPPVSPAMIKILEQKNELYPEMAEPTEASAFGAAVTAAEGADTFTPDEKDAIQRSHPFEATDEIPIRALAQSPYHTFFEGHYGYGKEDDPTVPRWRRIDTDWLGSSENLALSINSYTNNTSLVLAVELPGGAQPRVLLFAADAQTGNWLSWQGLSWPGAGPGGAPVTAQDLLARTVLYKVGHHGSRNATLSQKGLEEMTNRDLVAMIPVDEQWARDEMKWEHPARAVLDRLEQKTAGRVIRTDRIPTGAGLLVQPASLNAEEWQAFQAHLQWDTGPDHLWIQFTISE